MELDIHLDSSLDGNGFIVVFLICLSISWLASGILLSNLASELWLQTLSALWLAFGNSPSAEALALTSLQTAGYDLREAELD